MRGPDSSDAPVAIVGMGCRFPGGADSPEAYWRLLRDGVDAVDEIPTDRFDVDEVFDPDPAVPGKSYSRWGGFLDRVDGFDAAFFGISPREARRMDPQQRLLLEVCCDALESGGQPLERLAGGRAGVYVGVSTHDYLDVQDVGTHHERADAHLNSGTAASIAANRVSYLLDLHGPSLAVDTACSSSLTAVHLARRSLATGECDLALAAGVGVLLAPGALVSFSKASMLSPRGRCHAFDAGADGFVRGEGCGVVVLKPLDRALADGDPVLAVLRGSAVNQDGRTTGLTVPSAAAQRAMIEQAHRDAGTDPARVDYVEAHGTGTPVGDPIEAEALGGALSTGRPDERPCLIGSAKTNIGHLEAAAGIAGLIKTVLALRHRQIPPSLHFDEPNPSIPFDDLKLRVATRLQPWPGDGPALAGVNSFGFGGANAHVILEEARGLDRDREIEGPIRAGYLLPLSARSPEALQELARRHRDALDAEDAPSLHDTVHTSAVRRSHHDERLAVVATSREEARAQLDAFVQGDDEATVARGRVRRGRPPKVAFVFPGMGPQWWGMGRQLLRQEPAFRDALERVDGHLRPEAGWSLLEELARDEVDSRVGDADIAHVANLAVQLGVAAVLREWGVTPDAVVGHSSGEMAAACLAGALSLPDAVHLAYHRGRLQHRTTGQGRMLAAAATHEEAAELLAGHEDEASLAAVNAPGSVTLSGSADVLQRIADTLTERGRFARFLAVNVPYHGPQMEAIRDEFQAVVRDLRAGSADVPLVSEVTGDWTDGTALDGAYWWRNVREPVRFADATARLLDAEVDTFVEIGPHPVLAGPLGETIAHIGADARVLASLRRHQDEGRTMLATLGELYVRGAPVAWSAVAPAGRCVRLPTYPWQRERYWFDDDEEDAPQRPPAHGVATGHPLLGRRLSSAHPTWEARLDDRDLAYLDAHGIDGATVFPGAGYLEMAFAAARELHGSGPLRLDDVRFHQLLFPGSPRRGTVQLHHAERDGGVEIHALPDRQDADWTLHATARMAPTDGAVHDPPLDLADARERCRRTRSVEDLYAAFERLGYRYRGPFRSLREIRMGDDAALARVALPDEEGEDRDPHRVHPGLLDGVLQLVAVAAVDPEEEGATAGVSFPVAVRRLALVRDPGRRGWAYVRVAPRSDGGLDELEADAWLFDDDGEPVLSLEGLRLRALEERAPARQDDLQDALYELAWEEAAPPAAAGVAAASRLRRAPEVAAEVAERFGPPEQAEPDMRHFLEAVEPQLDRLADGFALAALESLGWSPERGRSTSTERLADDFHVASGQRRLFRALAARARTLARLEPDAFRDLPRAAAKLHGRAAALIDDDPGPEAEIELVRRGGARLDAVLRGELDPREVMLTEEARTLLRRFYTDSPPCRTAHRRLAEAIRAATAEVGEARPLRVLELGAGTGAATEAVLPVLPEGAELTFTDVSRFFWDEARTRFGARSDMSFATLDIEVDPVEQGFEPHAYDLVFAANVLHVTRDLPATLGNVRRLLAEDGLLAVMELTRPARWLNLVFGLLEGWWRYEDEHRQRGSPLVDANTWNQLFRSGGYRDVTSLYGAAPYQRRVHAVQLAHAPAPVAVPTVTATDAARHWWVFRDEEGSTDPVVQALRRAGDRCTELVPGPELRVRADGTVQLPPDDDDAYAQLLRTAGVDAPDGVVHAWSLR
ncbi:MAG: beta-ketoacyl synthase N-terminal-like domain-containing protein, partial [Trueperaceae bacterium]